MKRVYNKSQVKESYNIVASEYAKRFFNELDSKPFDRNLLIWFSTLIPKNQRVCEMGCGPGEIAAFLLEQGVNISGLDISENMIETAKKLNPKIDFYQGDMLDLNFSDESFSGIVAFYAIVHFGHKEIEAAFREFKRILLPGGYVLFSFHVGNEVIHTENFLDKDAPLDFYFFDPDEIIKIIEKIKFSIADVLIRYPYKDVEYESKRAYLILKK